MPYSQINDYASSVFLCLQVKYFCSSGKLICTMVDPHLPTIPSLKIIVTSEYPDRSPRIVGMARDYGMALLSLK